jgi:outer membrane protein with glycine zipper
MVVAVGLGGCANMTTTEQRTLSGAGIGALGGAAIAAIAEGSVATGALIGAGVGAGAGYLYSRAQNERHAADHSTKNRRSAARATKPPRPDNTARTSADRRVAANSAVKSPGETN